MDTECTPAWMAGKSGCSHARAREVPEHAKAIGCEGRGRFIRGSYITNQHTTCKKTPLGPLQAAQDARTVMVHLAAV
jgi:hypothetical protein